jgi:pyrroloquinoline quinone biosynthesis protein E
VRRLAALAAAGLDHVQLSVQDAAAASSDAIAGHAAWARKVALAPHLRALGLAFTLNVVLHRRNADHVPALVALAEELGADRLELATVQLHGRAFVNRATLLPTRAQIERARAEAASARTRLLGRVEIAFVLPDHHAGVARACMDGWARRFVVIAPDGLVLPCHAARAIPGLGFESVRDRPLAEIWQDSPALARFRGDAWMPEPCRSCDRKEVDFGGCRCQAFQLTGDAGATDPACARSPLHHLVTRGLPQEPA